MKTCTLIKTIVILMLATPLLCYAEWDAGKPPISKPFIKMGRGIVNAITSPLELPNQMYILSDHARENSPYRIETLAAAIEGVFMGTVYAFWRLGAGAYETLTFPIPYYESRIITPPYITISYEAYYEKEPTEHPEAASGSETSSDTPSEDVDPNGIPQE